MATPAYVFMLLWLLALAAVAAQHYGTVNVQINSQHEGHSQRSAGEGVTVDMQPPVEVDAVWGCAESNAKPRSVTSGCMEGTSITISGRNFGKSGGRVLLVPVNQKLPTSLNGEPLSCLNVQHSKLLPSLVLTCTLPAGAAPGSSYHVKVAVRGGITSVRRNAVQFAALEKPDASGKPKADERLRVLDPAKWVDLGVGGLGKQFKELFRRAFGSRLAVVSSIASNINLRHVKGVIFYGLPGTGKTLVARKVAEALGSKHVRVVNGPEIMSKFVGESEKNLRELFHDAEASAASEGANAPLHVIIIDEIDAIMRSRGAKNGDDSAARAVYDGVTTQMLAYMDGVKTSNNLLIIGLTNRLDSLDPALLRPGRFEVQIRFPLPDAEGRAQILDIHTKPLQDNKYLGPDLDLKHIVRVTASFSGADLAAVVRSATSYGMERLYSSNLSPEDAEIPFVVTQADMMRGVREVLAAKSASANTEPHLKHGYIVYNKRVQATLDRLGRFAEDVKSASSPVMLRILLEGSYESGLTATAAAVARFGEFPYIHIVSPDAFIGLSTDEKIERLRQVFDAALQAPAACIVLDSIESLLEYNAVRNSINAGLQIEIAHLLRRATSAPTKGSAGSESEGRVLVVATSSNADAVRTLSSGATLFDAVEAVFPLQRDDVAVVAQMYGVSGDATRLQALVSLLPPNVGIKRVVSWLQLAAGRAKVLSGPLAPAVDDALQSRSRDTAAHVIPVDSFEQVLDELGVLRR